MPVFDMHVFRRWSAIEWWSGVRGRRARRPAAASGSVCPHGRREAVSTRVSIEIANESIDRKGCSIRLNADPNQTKKAWVLRFYACRCWRPPFRIVASTINSPELSSTCFILNDNTARSIKACGGHQQMRPNPNATQRPAASGSVYIPRPRADSIEFWLWGRPGQCVGAYIKEEAAGRLLKLNELGKSVTDNRLSVVVCTSHIQRKRVRCPFISLAYYYFIVVVIYSAMVTRSRSSTHSSHRVIHSKPYSSRPFHTHSTPTHVSEPTVIAAARAAFHSTKGPAAPPGPRC